MREFTHLHPSETPGENKIADKITSVNQALKLLSDEPDGTPIQGYMAGRIMWAALHQDAVQCLTLHSNNCQHLRLCEGRSYSSQKYTVISVA